MVVTLFRNVLWAIAGFFIGISSIQAADTCSAAIDQTKLDALVSHLSSAHAAKRYKEVHSLIVHAKGQTLAEAYFYGNTDAIDFEGGIRRVAGEPKRWGPDDKHYVASVTKGVTALLTGIALAQLNLRASEPVAVLFAENAALRHPRWPSALTIEHLLTMQAGFVWDEWTGYDLVQLWQSSNFASYLLNKEHTGEGQRWSYNSALPNLLLKGLQNGLDVSLDTWADQYFFKPLGIVDYQWAKQPDGTPEGSARLHLRPQDMLKIGLLLLNNGRVGDNQLVPEVWIRQMMAVQVEGPAGKYGYFVWPRRIAGHDYVAFEGDGGQYINVFPKFQLVIVMTQGNYLQWPFYREQAESVMAEILLAQ